MLDAMREDDLYLDTDVDVGFAVEKFVQAADSDDYMRSLRLFDGAESDFVRLTPAQAQRVMGESLEHINPLRRLIRATLDRAQDAYKAGNDEEAARLVRTLERFAEAQEAPDTYALARLFADLVRRELALVEDAREDGAGA
ncbi:MAG: hypothetical protein EA379_08175 [Phycisphaerales bacterium]|nr:MAG: hypothetical protein EA379_08175 [Phycisphaerales bacterium]